MPETLPETPLASSLADTKLTDRELLIHAIQHLEILTDQVGEMYEALEPLKPLVAKLASRRRLFP